MIENRILPGNCLDSLKTLPDCSVDCCVTSPPYFNLRDYGTAMDEPERTMTTSEDNASFLECYWPWRDELWKPTPENRIRELEKAGALIAAEIDRLLRLGA